MKTETLMRVEDDKCDMLAHCTSCKVKKKRHRTEKYPFSRISHRARPETLNTLSEKNNNKSEEYAETRNPIVNTIHSLLPLLTCLLG